jgi:RNA polymerase sigma factor (sigma-70 family)
MTEDPFVAHRGLLFTVAYEMLGSAADAEDVLQESWLRWADVDRSQVRDPRSYLIRVVTRQALNRLRTLLRSREDYVGEWLPEPLLTSPDVAEDVELAESVSIAMLTVLETLAPAERAVFVLRVAQRRARGPDRGRRRAGRGEPRGGGRAGHPGLPGPKPAKADPAGRTGRPRQVTRCPGVRPHASLRIGGYSHEM